MKDSPTKRLGFNSYSERVIANPEVIHLDNKPEFRTNAPPSG
jgi:hypothetical protein